MEEEDEKRYSQPPYFPFRKSNDGSNNNFARPVTIHEGGSTEGLSREETENFHVASSRTTWNGGPPQPQRSQVPIVPPRPVPKPPAPKTGSNAAAAPTQNDEFRAALAQRLAKVSTEGS